MIDRNSIRRALAPLHASEDTIEEVLKMARQENTKRRYYPARRIMAVAAVIAVMVAALCGVAYAANWFGVQDVLLGHTVVVKGWDEEGNYGFTEKNLEVISMRCLSDSPEDKAYQEYKAFYDDYMLNDWETDDRGVKTEENLALQTAYSYVFNDTLSEKLLEICEKYGLKTHGMMHESADMEQLADILSVQDILEERVQRHSIHRLRSASSYNQILLVYQAFAEVLLFVTTWTAIGIRSVNRTFHEIIPSEDLLSPKLECVKEL